MCCYPFQILTFFAAKVLKVFPLTFQMLAARVLILSPFFGINAGRLRTCLNASGPVVGIETSCYVLIGDADKCIT
jgi:hypothetical protein